MKRPLFPGVGLCVLLFTACASTISAPQRTPDTPTSPPRTQAAASSAEEHVALRVIVTFKNAVDYRSDTLLQMLRTHIQARQVTYVSSVYGNTYIYLIQLTEGQSEAQVLHLLQSMPIVRSAEIDRIARAS